MTPSAPSPLRTWLEGLPADERLAREADLERLAMALARLLASAWRAKTAAPEEARPPGG